MTLAMLAQVACINPTADDEEVAETGQDIAAGNGLADNGLADNGLADNGLADNGLADNGLADNGLAYNESLKEALTDPSARELFKYVVSCALPASAHVSVEVEGVTYGFDGALGLAPEWGEEGGSCDDECRSWVSGCVISRLDYLGEHVVISLRGNNGALKTTPQERAKYSHVEATYYGDIFGHKLKVFACLPSGKTDIPRVCGPSLDDCIVEVQGKCEDLCDARRSDGAYPNCREASHGKNHPGTKHLGSVTVFLK